MPASNQPGGRSLLDRPLTALAAEVTFFAVFSVFPLLLVLAATLGLLEEILGHDLAARAEMAVVEFLEMVLTERASFVVDSARDLFGMDSGGLLTTAGLVALWTITSAFAALIRALDMIYNVAERRAWWNIRLTALALALGTLLVLAGALGTVVTGPLLGAGPDLDGRPGISQAISVAWAWTKAPAVFLLLVLWITTLYHLAPNTRRRWVSEIRGGALAAVLWLFVTYGFNLYLHLAIGANRLLGVLGGGLILMVWLYLLTVVLLLGAKLNAWLMNRGVPR